jgi:hypothetical protein
MFDGRFAGLNGPLDPRRAGATVRVARCATSSTNVAGAAVNNLFLEFWPDAVNKIHRRLH